MPRTVSKFQLFNKTRSLSINRSTYISQLIRERDRCDDWDGAMEEVIEADDHERLCHLGARWNKCYILREAGSEGTKAPIPDEGNHSLARVY